MNNDKLDPMLATALAKTSSLSQLKRPAFLTAARGDWSPNGACLGFR